MNVKSIEKNGNQATVVVEIDKELMESGVQKAYLRPARTSCCPASARARHPAR